MAGPDIIRFVDLFDLKSLAPDLYQGHSPQDTASNRIFGGQVAAQACIAATRTVEDGHVHSLHAYFLTEGDPQAPIDFRVRRVRDGRSYSVRFVEAVQGEKVILSLTGSFHRGSDTEEFEHQMDHTLAVPPPEEVRSYDALLEDWGMDIELPPQFRLIDFRPVEFVDPRNPKPMPPERRVWFRSRNALPDDGLVHLGATIYASDLYLLGTALMPHGVPSNPVSLRFASLDHAMWFHRPFRADEWLLHVQRTPSASNGRGLATGSIYAADGRLVVSTSQEGVIQRRR
jgi:acyl-CoA thioesterase II